MTANPDGISTRTPDGAAVVEAPTSFAQHRLWLIDQLEQGETAYAVLIPTRLRGTLDVEALTESLTAVVARHEVLRTTFPEIDGEPVQRVHPPRPVPLPLVDLSPLSAQDRQRALTRIVHDQESKPFDLRTGPLVRATLLRLAPRDHVLLCGIHHIAVDVPSIHLLYDELAAGYNARMRGDAPELPALTLQYRDFAAWEQQRMAGPLRAEQLAYWRGQLDAVPPLDLPTDRQPTELASGSGGFLGLDLPEHLLDGLQALAAAEQVSIFDVLVAGLKTVLARYTGQDDLAVGTVLHKREQPGTERLIGFFANTVVLRTDVGGAPTFRELVHRVAAVAADADEHAAVPFDAVVGELRAERAGNRNPLFRVYFGLDETPDVLPPFDGLEVTGMLPDFSTAKFDLGFKVRTRSHDSSPPTLFSIFSRDLFDDETIERLLGHFRTVLTSAAADPDRPVTELPMLTDGELADVFGAWNDTDTAYPDEQTLHGLFEQKTIEGAGTSALFYNRHVLVYGALNERANRVAHHLRARGVGRNSIVGVCLPKGFRQATAILAVLKAGGAFLPLDPSYPASRLSFMIEDSDAWGVLTERDLLDRVPPTERVVLPLDGMDDPFTAYLTDERLDEPSPLATPDDLAYVIYTSGSTGTPKGVAITHRGAVNNFTDFVRRFDLKQWDPLLAVSPMSFDMSVYDLLGTLAGHGTVVIPTAAQDREPASWAALIREHLVAVWHSAPALLELLCDYVERHEESKPLPLRLVLLGGDWIPVGLPDRIRAIAPDARVVSLGGATEASMDSILYEVDRVDPDWRSIPYGRPMANQRAYVLDPNRQPLPVGVPGQLHLAGVGLAEGYLNRPELTEQRFVSHTFDNGVHERLFATGDLARYRADGVIELLGRMDFQVKVHGLRVELGEIESALRRHEAVAEAVVVARGEPGAYALAAFVRPAAGHEVSREELRRSLRTALPEHMVPSTITVLTEFPTTPNGKIDRGALRTWDVLAEPAGGVAPRDVVEGRIAAIWRDVLGAGEISAGEIGIDDDFFALGGDSFTAVRAMLALDAAVPVVELFKTPTIRLLANRVRGGVAGWLLHELTPPRDAETSIVCLPYGGGNAVNYAKLAQALPGRFALWAAALPGHDPGSRDQQFLPLPEAAARLADEIATRLDGPVVVYGHCAGAPLGVLLAHEAGRRGVDVRAVYVAGSLPDPDPAASLRRAEQISDREYADHLASIGGFAGALDSVEVEIIMRAGRNDMVEATRFFQRGGAAIGRRPTIPVHCVIGDADPTTEDFEHRHTDWLDYAEAVDLTVIPGGDHYFIRDHADDLAALLDRHLAD